MEELNSQSQGYEARARHFRAAAALLLLVCLLAGFILAINSVVASVVVMALGIALFVVLFKKSRAAEDNLDAVYRRCIADIFTQLFSNFEYRANESVDTRLAGDSGLYPTLHNIMGSELLTGSMNGVQAELSALRLTSMDGETEDGSIPKNRKNAEQKLTRWMIVHSEFSDISDAELERLLCDIGGGRALLHKRCGGLTHIVLEKSEGEAFELNYHGVRAASADKSPEGLYRYARGELELFRNALAALVYYGK